MEDEIRRISFIIASEGIKYLGRNFRKYMQDLNIENNKKVQN